MFYLRILATCGVMILDVQQRRYNIRALFLKLQFNFGDTPYTNV